MKWLLFCTVLAFYRNPTTYSHNHQCKHRHPRHDEIGHVFIEPHHLISKRSIDQNLRILLYYDESVYRLDHERFKLINETILPSAVNFWQSALLVRKTERTIRLTRKCNESQIFVKDSLTYCIDSCRERTMCGEVAVPEDHLDACRTCNSTGQKCRQVR